MDRVRADAERDIERKVAELEQKAKASKSDVTLSLSLDYERKLLAIEQSKQEQVQRMEQERERQVDALRRQLHQEQQSRTAVLDREKQLFSREREALYGERNSLRCQLDDLRKKLESEFQRSVKLQTSVHAVIEERDKLKQKLQAQGSGYMSDQNRNQIRASGSRETGDDTVRRRLSLSSVDSQSSSTPVNSRPPSPTTSGTTTPVISRSSSPTEDMSQFADILRHRDRDHFYNGSTATIDNIPSQTPHVGYLPERSVSTPGLTPDPHTTPPVKGVVAPQLRSVPSSPQRHNTTPFRRDDRLRATVQPSQMQRRPQSEVKPFSRQHSLRATMPERKIVYVSPERRKTQRSDSISSVESAPDSTRKERPRSALFSWGNRKNKNRHSSSDSGCPVSPISNNGDIDPEKPDLSQLLTNFQILTSETITAKLNSPKRQAELDKRWKELSTHLAQVTDYYRQTLSENAFLREQLRGGGAGGSFEQLESLQEEIARLQQENRRLRRLCDMLQGSSTQFGQSPYDRRTYHFYSNC